MYIALNAKVDCLDGYVSCVIGVVINPNGNFVTHLIARSHWFDMEEQLIALHHITTVTSSRVAVNLTRARFATLPKHYQTQSLLAPLTNTMPWPDDLPTLADTILVTRRSLVLSHLKAVEDKTPVYAIDGFIGRIAAFKIDPRSYEIINVSADMGWLWNRQRIQLLPHMIVCYREDGALLRMPKRQLWMRTQPMPI